MDSPFSVISNFFTDGIFGNLIRFLFDRIFGSHFTTNINISSIINLKNGSFKDLQLDPVKVNKKHFKNSPLKLFSGSIGSLSIKFPQFNLLLTESIEVNIDKLDLLFYLGDVDFSAAESQNQQPSKKESPQEDESLEAGLQKLDKNFDVYKKIIDRILLNTQLKVQNICIRVVNGKPYKDIRLPVAPCFMLKLGEIEFKRDFSKSTNVDESGMIFSKQQKYDISISSITAHMMSNYELKTNEYQGESTTGAIFPFTYPNEFHPSTFFVCACKKKSDSGRNTTKEIEPIHIKIKFSHDKSKTIDINIPHIEIMLDFLKIKYLSRYLDKAMELKRFSDYKKGLNLISMQVKKVRKESFDMNQDNIKIPRSRRDSEIISGTIPSNNPSQKIKIAGYMIDTAYFQANKDSSSKDKESDTTSSIPQDLKLEGISDLENQTLSPENFLDPNNMRVKLQLSSFHAYLLKSSSAFMDSEFKRYWLFGCKPQNESPTFNKRIPINYFQVRFKKVEFTHDSKESNTEIQFNSLCVFDVCRIENPSKYKMNQTYKSNTNTNSNPNSSTINNSKFMSCHGDSSFMNKSEIYQSFKKPSDLMSGNLIVGNSMNSEGFEMAQSHITKEFLGIRELNKQLIDWELDSKNHHFCLNVIFKLSKKSKKSNDSSSDKKSDSNSKFSEDAVIHTPLNEGPVNPENEYPEKNIIFRIYNKNGKKGFAIELTQIYLNFYPSLVNDFNSLLHDASAWYTITENWYWDQNQGIIKKWDEEVIDEKMKSMNKENYDEKKINRVIEDYEATQQSNIDLVFSVQLIKAVINLENVHKDTSTCFCGFTSLFTEKPTHSNPLFTTEFIIIDIESIGIRAIKLVNNGQDDLSNRNLVLSSSVILQSINVYIPNDICHDGQILLTCLLSLKNPRVKAAGDSEEKRIIPNILIRIFEDNQSHEISNNISKEDFEMKDNKDLDSPFKKDRQSLNLRDTEYQETSNLYDNFQKHMNKNMCPDLKYINSIKSEASTSITVTLPIIEVFTSRVHLRLVNNFFKNLKGRIKDVDAKIQEIINEEKKFYSSIILKSPTVKKVSPKAIQIYLDQLSIYSFYDDMVESKYRKFVSESKKKGNISEFINNSLRIDASVRLDASITTQSIVAQGATNVIKMQYPSKEFIETAKGNLSVLIRHIESIFYSNPIYGISLVHAEVYDLTVIDKSQENILFGSFEKIKDQEKREYIEDDIESYNAIIYKQSRYNYAEKNLTTYKPLKAEEFWKNMLPDYSLCYLESSFKVFEYKKTNILSLGVFTYNFKDTTSMDLNIRMSELNFRSDFKLECIDLIKNMVSVLNDNNKDHEEVNSPSLSIKRDASIKRDSPLLLKLSLENIMIDINPYYTKNYYSMNLKRNVEAAKQSNLYYSGMRTLLAIERIELNFSKIDANLKLDTFKVSELDVLMRNQRNYSIEDNSLILRSSKAEKNLFEDNYAELMKKYKFVYQVIKLSNFVIEKHPNDDLTITLRKITSSVYFDTLASIESQIHLILFLLGKKSDQVAPPAQNKKSILKNKHPNVHFKEDLEFENDSIVIDYNCYEKLKFEIDDDDDCLVVDDGFEDEEKLSDVQSCKSDDHVSIEDDKQDGLKEIVLIDTLENNKTEIGFIESSIRFFKEKFMHNFSFNDQQCEKKMALILIDIEFNVHSGSIFPVQEQESEDDMKLLEEASEIICLKVKDIAIQHAKFKPNNYTETNIDWRISSSVGNIEVIDVNSKGKPIKLFSKLEETDTLTISGRNMFKNLKESKITVDHMVNLVIESYERKPLKKRDLRIFIGIHPIELNLSKPHYNFFKNFISKMQKKRISLQNLSPNKEPSMAANDNNPQINIPESPYFIPMFVIAPLELKMKVNLDISVISFDLFKDCTLLFDTFTARGLNTTSHLKGQIIEFYIKQLKKQTGKFVKDLPLLRNVKNLSKATLNVFYSPYSEIVYGGNVTLGLKDGIVGLFGSIANESTNLFTFFAGTVENIASEIKGISSRR